MKKTNPEKIRFAAVVALALLSMLALVSNCGLLTYRFDIAGFQPELGFCYVAKVEHGLPGIFVASDGPGAGAASRLQIFEDGVPLGPAHSAHQSIRDEGRGRYSHWGDYVYLSATDNSNPLENGRQYSARIPLTVPLYITIPLCLLLLVLVQKYGWVRRRASRVAVLLNMLYRSERHAGFVAVLLTVAVLGQLVFLLGSSIGYNADSGMYLFIADALKERADFSTLGHLRTPGYPLFLAGIFRLFDAGSALPLRAVQHLFAVVIVLAVYGIAAELFRNRFVAFVCGLVSCCSLQLWAYANLVMTEIPYTCLLTLAVFALVRYCDRRSNVSLAAAGLLVGLASIVKPVAQPLVVFVFAAWLYMFVTRRPGRFYDLGAIMMATALLLVCTVPWMAYNYVQNGYFGLTKSMGENLYSRVVEYESTIDFDSPAIQDIRQTFERDRAQRIASGEAAQLQARPGYDYDYYMGAESWKHHKPATKAYVRYKQIPHHEADSVFLRASLDCIKKYPLEYFATTIRYALRQLVHVEQQFCLIPGLSGEQKKQYPFSCMLEAEKANETVFTRWHAYGYPQFIAVVDRYLIRTEAPTLWTAVYTRAAAAYLHWMNDGNRTVGLAVLLALGFLAVLWSMLRSCNRLQWAIFTTILLYHTFFPMLFVPGTYRMRIPLDPLLVIVYVAGAVLVLKTLQVPIQWFAGFFKSRSLALHGSEVAR